MKTHNQLFARKQPTTRRPADAVCVLAAPVGPGLPPPPVPAQRIITPAAPKSKKKTSILHQVAKTGKLPSQANRFKPQHIGPPRPGALPAITSADIKPQASELAQLKRKLAAADKRCKTLEELAQEASHTTTWLAGIMESNIAAATKQAQDTTTAYTNLVHLYNTLLMTCDVHIPKRAGWDFPPYPESQVRHRLNRIYYDLQAARRRREDERTHWDASQLTAPLPVNPDVPAVRTRPS